MREVPVLLNEWPPLGPTVTLFVGFAVFVGPLIHCSGSKLSLLDF
jgi:hypothetical protein